MLTLIIYLPFLVPASIALHTSSRPETPSNLTNYAHPHSYSHAYPFSRRDGWDNIPVSDLAYKYRRDTPTEGPSAVPSRLEKRSRKPKSRGGSLGGVVQHVVNATLKGIGKIEAVTITWYTGNDLKNPSCWKKPVWAPSDDSFACALTLEGWTNRPKCFQFLELCNGTKKCIFVRVVDTCAGCPKGSKHVDLTKAAFEALASLDEGILQVNMRLATDPHEWNEGLWGPQDA